MTAPSLEFSSLGRIHVVRVLPGLGDMLCLVPALRALRRSAPQATISLYGLPSAAWLPERFPHLVDEWIPVSHWPGVPEASGRADEWRQTRAAWERTPPDLVLQLHGSGRTTNAPILAMPARSHAGHHPPHEPPPGPCFRPWPDHGREAARLTGLVSWLGGRAAGDRLEFPVDVADLQTLRGIVDADEPYVCIHPGASRPDRRWTPEGFAAVADWLAERGRRVFLTGTAPEEPIARAVADRMQRPASIVTGQLDLGAMAALLRGADLAVSNDTGVAHLAAAVDARNVVVFTTSDAERWGPTPSPKRRTVQAGECPATDDVLREVELLLP